MKKYLKNGTYYLRKYSYSFSREWIIESKVLDITPLNLVIKLQKERIKYSKNKPIKSESKAILLTSINDSKDIKLFYGFRQYVKFLKEDKGFPSTKETLFKYIIKGKPYYSYHCKFV